jgi:hypothetical protein
MDDVYDEASRIWDEFHRDAAMEEFVNLVREAKRLHY